MYVYALGHDEEKSDRPRDAKLKSNTHNPDKPVQQSDEELAQKADKEAALRTVEAIGKELECSEATRYYCHSVEHLFDILTPKFLEFPPLLGAVWL